MRNGLDADMSVAMKSLSLKMLGPNGLPAVIAVVPFATVTGSLQESPPSREVATMTLGPVKFPPGPSWSAMFPKYTRPRASKASAGSPVNWYGLMGGSTWRQVWPPSKVTELEPTMRATTVEPLKLSR